jgi:hypothetical protein
MIFQDLEWPGQIHDNTEDPHKHLAADISSAYDVLSRLEHQETDVSVSIDCCNERPTVAEYTRHNRPVRTKLTSENTTKELNSPTAYQNRNIDDYSASLIWVPFQSVSGEFLQDQHSSFIPDECFPADVSDELSLASSEHLYLNDADAEASAPQPIDTERKQSPESKTGCSKAVVECKSVHLNPRMKRYRSKSDDGQLHNQQSIFNGFGFI